MDDTSKLSRNKVPELLQAEGHIPVTFELPVHERLEKLKFMLLDATARLIDVKEDDIQTKTELLSLIQELTETIIVLDNVPSHEIARATRERLKKYGSYSNGLVMDGAILNPAMIDSETYRIYMNERLTKLRQQES
jgi:predicted house-cleaning noncanonical NTP pyrophosphatase (MazG superfamily)